MSDALSSAELNGCQVELLPARTVLSLFAQAGITKTKGGFGGILAGLLAGMPLLKGIPLFKG